MLRATRDAARGTIADFANWDTDGDGVLDETEWEDFIDRPLTPAEVSASKVASQVESKLVTRRPLQKPTPQVTSSLAAPSPKVEQAGNSAAPVKQTTAFSDQIDHAVDLIKGRVTSPKSDSEEADEASSPPQVIDIDVALLDSDYEAIRNRTKQLKKRLYKMDLCSPSLRNLEYSRKGVMFSEDVQPHGPQYGQVYRHRRLHEAFKAFDMDDSGRIGVDEFYELGVARRVLGQVSGEWSRGENDRFVQKMKRDPVSPASPVLIDEFVSYHDERMPHDKEGFDKAVEEYKAVASYLERHTYLSTVPNDLVVNNLQQLVDERTKLFENSAMDHVISVNAIKSELSESHKNVIELKDTDIRELQQTVKELQEQLRHHAESPGMLKEIRDLRRCLAEKDDELDECYHQHQNELNALNKQLRKESADVIHQKQCDIEELLVDKQTLLTLLDEQNKTIELQDEENKAMRDKIENQEKLLTSRNARIDELKSDPGVGLERVVLRFEKAKIVEERESMQKEIQFLSRELKKALNGLVSQMRNRFERQLELNWGRRLTTTNDRIKSTMLALAEENSSLQREIEAHNSKLDEMIHTWNQHGDYATPDPGSYNEVRATPAPRSPNDNQRHGANDLSVLLTQSVGQDRQEDVWHKLFDPGHGSAPQSDSAYVAAWDDKLTEIIRIFDGSRDSNVEERLLETAGSEFEGMVPEERATNMGILQEWKDDVVSTLRDEIDRLSAGLLKASVWSRLKLRKAAWQYSQLQNVTREQKLMLKERQGEVDYLKLGLRSLKMRLQYQVCDKCAKNKQATTYHARDAEFDAYTAALEPSVGTDGDATELESDVAATSRSAKHTLQGDRMAHLRRMVTRLPSD